MRIALGAVVALSTGVAGAQELPTGGTVVPGGSATISTSGSTKTIDQSSARAIIDWNTFNVGNGATVTFSQPGSSSVAVNRVGPGAGQSAIDGALNANGHVMILNPNGVMFGPTATVDVAGLIASTGSIDDTEFMAGGDFSITGATGAISNQGTITVPSGGRVTFIAPTISNSGAITAPSGRISLASANAATVTWNGGLYEVAVTQAATGGSIVNTGTGLKGLRAIGSGGTIALSALNEGDVLSSTINLQGIQQANTIVVHGDQVVLASDLDASTVSGDSKTVDVQSGAQIQDGVDIARSGATVNVAAGSYSPFGTDFGGPADLTIIGAAGAQISLDGSKPLQRIVDLRADGTTFEGFSINGGGNHVGVSVSGRGVTVSDNTIDNVLTGIQTTTQYVAGNNTITGNTVTNSGYGISLQNNSNTVTNNTIDVATEGLGIGSKYNTISNNDLSIGTNGVQLQTYTTADYAKLPGADIDLLQVVADNKFNRAAYITDGSSVTVQTIFGGIQSAIDKAAAGNVVNVLAGTYAESLTIGKALTLSGAGAGKSIIDPVSGNGISIGGDIDAAGSIRIDGFTFQDAPVAGIDVASNTVLDTLTVENSDFTGNARFGFRVSGNSSTGVPGLNRVELLDSTFHANGRNYTDPAITSLGYGDISINYYNGDATLRNLAITGYASGGGADQGIQLRGTNVIRDAGTVVFDNVSIAGSYRRPDVPCATCTSWDNYGTWNPGGPGTALHILGYDSVANISFNDVTLAPTVGHGLFAEGLSTPLDIGNTVFGVPDTTITGGGASPTRSWNILSGTNDQNNVLTNIDATGASFTGAADGFAIEDRVLHAMDSTALGLVTWKEGNLYVTPGSGSIQRGMDLAAAGDTLNVAAGTYAEDVDITAPLNLAFDGSTVHSLTVTGSGAGIGGSVTADGASGFTFNAPTTLLSDTTLTTKGSDIALNADVQGSARALGLIAGSGDNRGDVFVTSGGTQSDPLGAFNVVARNYELQGTLWVDHYTIDATANVALSNHTLRALGSGVTSTINAVGNITGSTISNGSSHVVSKGNVAANVTAAGTAVVSGNNVQGNINAGSAVVSGNNVQGNISANSVTVSAQQNVQVNLNTQTAVVHAGGSASLSGSAPKVTINASKGGSLSGDFGQVSNVGGGVVAVNGKPRVNDSLADSGYNHRALPVETAVGGEPATLRSATSASFAPFAGPNVQLSRVGPGDVLEPIDEGRSVEIDLSPRNEPERQKK